MISKGYHYVINLGIFSNFLYQYRPCLSWILGKGPIVAGELRRIWVLPSPQILKSIIHDEFRQSIIDTYISIQALFCFHFPHFYVAYNFVVLQKSAPQPAVLWCYTLNGHIPPFWNSVNLSDTFKTQMKQKNHSFCMTISRRGQDGAKSIISCMVYLIMVDMSFSENTDDFFWFRQNSGA